MKFGRKSTPQTRRQRLTDTQDESKLLGAFSYAGNAPRQPQADQKAAPADKPRRFWLARLGVLIFLVAATASAVNLLSLAPSAKVLPLKEGGDQVFLRSTVTYEAAANKLLKSSAWNRTKITLNASQLSQQMLGQFPELTSVSVTVPLLAHQPLIYIQPARAALVLATANGSYLVDTAGKALLKAGDTTQFPKNLPVLTDQSGLNVELNHQALPANNVRFIQIVLAELAARQYSTSSLVLPAASSELDAHLVGQPYFVKFNLQGDDPRGQAGTFLATVTNLKRQNITPAQYVDVRVPGRAYYQ